MYRSMLYCPASSEKFVAKAADRGADAIILDLEDGVAPGEKAAARAGLPTAVPRCAAQGADVWVRINRPLRQTIADIEAVVRAGAKGVLLAKTDSADHLRLMAEVAAEVEREIGRTVPLAFIPMIESPAALGNAAAIAAEPRVLGLLTGGEDIATELGAVPSAETLRLPKLLVHIAAKSARKYSFGTLGTVADYGDAALIRSLAAEARRHGFDGATCVHPTVVPLLNEGFSPSPDALAEATEMIAAFEDSLKAGRGAFTFRGKMVDEPVVERARRLLRTVRT